MPQTTFNFQGLTCVVKFQYTCDIDERGAFEYCEPLEMYYEEIYQDFNKKYLTRRVYLDFLEIKLSGNDLDVLLAEHCLKQYKKMIG